ncbi:F420-dependent NADP oxidoreductase [Corynebacterium sp. HMSC08A12]|uniref:Rossmann-like and DUF2520 domain-containing protein n=1 Tax=Corynebacterium sp. HMSC08A12 TaxID=1581134 RepID=UPI0008A24A65|nr:DUF2520 domain-containing protein [Corynebacterium sp. HMSC08A12]OFT36597.1 F420-dependent NADP oxidoreductase [Corynebacterium sp. HMSC08A12]
MTGPTTNSDIQQPRLSVGIISAGKVGVALAEAFARAGHHVHGIYAHSARSEKLASERIPNIPRINLDSTAHAALVVLAVPDPKLPEVVEEVAQHTRDGQIVAHVSGAFGCEILQPITDTGALPLALHPAMTFTGTPADSERLDGCAWGVTSDSEVGDVVAQTLVASLGGVPVAIPEHRRAAYHAAMAHAANHLVTLLTDAQEILDRVLEAPGESPDSALLLRRIAHAAVDNALEKRMDGLTGPVARDDAEAVMRHRAALRELEDGPDSAEEGAAEAAYTAMARRTALKAGAIEVERLLDLE